MISDNDILWRYCTIAASLLHAQRLSDDKYNFKCNICGDGKRKKRGYLVFDRAHDLVYYKCFNEGDCAAAGEGNAWHGSKWLKNTDKRLYESYRAEVRENRLRKYLKPLHFKNETAPNTPQKTVSTKDAMQAQTSAKATQNPPVAATTVSKSDVEKEFLSFLPIKKCPDRLKGCVKEFCQSRRLPKERVREFRIAVEGKYRDRIVIPTYDEKRNVTYFQCRALLGQTPKYLNSKAPRENVIYGLDRIDPNKPVIVLEGPIDSMFIENAVATMGCSYSKEVQERLDKLNCFYLMDNDRAGNSKSRDLLMTGRKVFLWSKFLDEKNVNRNVKDMNDFVLAGNADLPLRFSFLEPYFTGSMFMLSRLTK